MMPSPLEEWEWWDGLDGEEVARNAWGWPHYDVEAVADFIEQHAPLGRYNLDLGCGPGRLGHVLAERNPDVSVFGIDVSPNMVSYANVNAPSNWSAQVSDGVTIPSGGKAEGVRPYSTVYAVTVFQHLPNIVVDSYVKQIYHRLVDDGRLIFTYATGDEIAPRSYQVQTEQALDWCRHFGSVQTLLTPDTHPNWNWMVARK
jgi:cyclopropane fatty-acyl-phospholipid synthase-like methyltransferase